MKGQNTEEQQHRQQPEQVNEIEKHECRMIAGFEEIMKLDQENIQDIANYQKNLQRQLDVDKETGMLKRFENLNYEDQSQITMKIVSCIVQIEFQKLEVREEHGIHTYRAFYQKLSNIKWSCYQRERHKEKQRVQQSKINVFSNDDKKQSGFFNLISHMFMNIFPGSNQQKIINGNKKDSKND